jgi:hypothetical protein
MLDNSFYFYVVEDIMNKQTENVPAKRGRLPVWVRFASVMVIALAFGAMMRATLLLAAPPAAPAAINSAQSNPADDGSDDSDGDDGLISRYGEVVSFSLTEPASLVITKSKEMTYSIDGATVIEGTLAEGVCVEVKSSVDAPDLALKIEVKDAEKCQGHDDDWNDDKDDDWNNNFGTYKGVVVSVSPGMTGTWVVGSKSFSVTAETIYEGGVDVGVCVEVYFADSEPTTALKIEAKAAEKCNGNDDDDDWDDDDWDDDKDDWDDDRDEFYGLVITRPVGSNIGLWNIGGREVTATEQTEFDFEYGNLEVGVCAKVELSESEPTVAREIDSTKRYKCDSRDDDNYARGVIFGEIESIPPDPQNGVWGIGGMTFTVSTTTQLITKGGTFTEGVIVKVEFRTNMSDTNYATKIEIKFGPNNPCRRTEHPFGRDDWNDDKHDDDRVSAAHGRDDNNRHYGYCPGNEGKAVGLVNDRPDDGTLIGDWMIGSVPYRTDAFTKFGNDDDFLEGERVRVEYVVLSDSVRLITKMKETDDNGGVSKPDGSLIVGYVMTKPVAFIGEWIINDASFQAVMETKFIERGSLFAVGAYVVVEYRIVNDQRVIDRILTFVPPGAGDDDKVGKLDSIGGVSVASASSLLQNDQVWTIDGELYVVSEATQLLDAGGELVPGTTVYVNSYTENGQRFATMIRTQSGKAFIPMIER